MKNLTPDTPYFMDISVANVRVWLNGFLYSPYNVAPPPVMLDGL